MPGASPRWPPPSSRRVWPAAPESPPSLRKKEISLPNRCLHLTFKPLHREGSGPCPMVAVATGETLAEKREESFPIWIYLNDEEIRIRV